MSPRLPGSGAGLTRRQFLAVAGALTAGAAVGCGRGRSPIDATAQEVERAENQRRRAGAEVHDLDLTAAPFNVDLAGLSAATWAYNGRLPGAEVRVRAGDVIRARFTNRLPEATTVHWHGIALRNDMDGAEGVTQEAVAAGGTFVYEFTVPDPGTYWFHPHVGLQLDQGLYAPLIVEDPGEPGRYDREVVLVLDDWTAGLSTSPEQNLEDLRAGRGAHALHAAGGGPRSELLKGAGGDVSYPLHLVNGRQPRDPYVIDASPGERLRLRFINAGSDTPYRVALADHPLSITHTDGFPVEPLTADAVIIGMSERYDVVVTAGSPGAYPLVAIAEAKANQGLAYLRVGGASIPSQSPPRIAELDRRVVGMAELRAAAAVTLPPGRPDRTHRVILDGGDEGYRWTINGKSGDDLDPLDVRQGEKVRLEFENRTTMFHPMHLHGHTFQVVEPVAGGPRKDSLIVLPDQRVAVDFIADNPGQWVLHCHNAYHMEGGMETLVSYIR